MAKIEHCFIIFSTVKNKLNAKDKNIYLKIIHINFIEIGSFSVIKMTFQFNFLVLKRIFSEICFMTIKMESFKYVSSKLRSLFSIDDKK